MKRFLMLCLLVLAVLFSGCQSNDELLDPDHPITVTVWHYYNGQTKEKFDELVHAFNDTVGMNRGIVIEASSQGDVQQLADAVFDAANKKIGAQPLPNIFAAYPDNAFRVHQIIPIVPLSNYFSEVELKTYREEFLEEGRFGEDNAYRILPVAKSSENLYLNKTFWTPFSEEMGADISQLSTWEGILDVSRLYYDWTDAQTDMPDDGKAFLGIDSSPNFMLIAAMQLGEEIYTFNESGEATLNFSEATARMIWEHFYVPYVEGLFMKSGRFSSDDAKIGEIVAYTGSTAGARYFPTQVTLSQNEVISIDCITLPYPKFEMGDAYAIQQGAGMCISSSDKAHEYASALFLKWFTEPEQNLKFAASTAYFPAKVEALNLEAILSETVLTDETKVNAIIDSSIRTTLLMMDTYTLYGNKPFKGSYEMRLLLEQSLFEQARVDLLDVSQRRKEGEAIEGVLKTYTSEKNFLSWYNRFIEAADHILRGL